MGNAINASALLGHQFCALSRCLDKNNGSLGCVSILLRTGALGLSYNGHVCHCTMTKKMRSITGNETLEANFAEWFLVLAMHDAVLKHVTHMTPKQKDPPQR